MLKIVRQLKNNKEISFIILIFCIFVLPKLIWLGFDEWNVDAQRWMIRSDLFIKNLFSGDFESTYQSYHPGVTLMWLSGLSKQIFYILFEVVKGYSPKLSSGFVYPEQFFYTAFISKLPLVIVISTLLTYSLLLLYKIGIDRKLIVLFAIALSLEPYFLGITRYYHLTGLESAFIFAAIVTTIYSTHKNFSKRFSLMIGLFVGLGFLTKSSALIVTPFIVAYMILTGIMNKTIKKAILNLSLVGLGCITTIFFVFPAMWVNPILAIQNIFTSGIEGKGFIDGPHQSILDNRFLYYYEILFIKSLGLTIILTMISLVLINKEKNQKLKTVFYTFGFYIVYYFLVMSIPSKQMTRYVTIAMPFLLFLSTYAFYKIIQTIKQQKYLYTLLAFLVIYYAVTLYCIFPNFSTYHTDLLGGMNGYAKMKKPLNDGEFYLQAAEFLNNYAGNDVRNSIMISKSDNKDASFRFAFLGQTHTQITKDKKFARVFYAIDYDEVDRVPNDCALIHGVGHNWPDKFDFVKIFECPPIQ